MSEGAKLFCDFLLLSLVYSIQDKMKKYSVSPWSHMQEDEYFHRKYAFEIRVRMLRPGKKNNSDL